MNIKSTVHGTPARGLAAATLGFYIGFAAVSLFGPTAKYLQTEIGIGAAIAGLLISIPNLTGSLLRIPFAAWADVDGGRKPFVVLLTLSLVGVVGVAAVLFQPAQVIPDLIPLLLFFGALGGCGVATFSVGIAQTSYWYPKNRQGQANALYGGLGNTAPGIFALLLTTVALPIFGLAASYVWWAIFLAVGLVGYLLLSKNAWYFQYRRSGMSESDARARAEIQGQELFPKGNALQSLVLSAKRPNTWLLVVAYFASFGGFLGLIAWLPSFGTGYLGLDLPLAGVLTAFYSVLASLVRASSGPLTDRFGGERTSLGGFGLALIGAFLVAFGLPAPITVTGLILMALGMGTANAGVFKLVPQAVPDAVGGAAGWVGGLGAFGGFVLPLTLNSLIHPETGTGYAEGFWIYFGLFALSFAIILILKSRSGGKQ